MVSNENASTIINEQYNLRWNNYSSNIIKVFNEHLLKESLVDVTLLCEGEFIKVHKLVLAACSEYFQNIFDNYNVAHPLILMNNVKLKDLKHIIKFIYCGETKVIETELQDLLDLGEILQVKGLSSLKLKENTPASSTKSDKPKPNPNNQTSDDNPKRNSTTATNVKKRKLSSTTSSAVDLPQETVRKHPTKKPKVKRTVSDSELVQSKKSLVTKKTNSDKVTAARSAVDLDQSSKNDGLSSNIPSANSLVQTTSPPPSAFMLFAGEWREKLAVEHPDKTNIQISMLIGAKWRRLTQEDRKPYYKAAEEAKLVHLNKYPSISRHSSTDTSQKFDSINLDSEEIIDLEPEVKIEEVDLEDKLNGENFY